ncbi:MAG: hypothetical protein OXM87_10500 [Truepera sp.]|nr:hypothetical protein [Truepera sp.]
MRTEVRAKTNLEIRMSDSPTKPDRAWDTGLRDDDIVALITCFDTGDGPEPANDAVYFTVGALRASVDRSKLGPPKSASEGAERDLTWRATVPTRDGTVLEVTDERLIVQMNADAERPARRQTYTLRGKSVYVSPGNTFTAQTTILAGEPHELADLSAYLPRRYTPLDDLQASTDVDRYAAVKALRFREDPRSQIIPALEDFIRRETEERVALEAAGSAAALGSELGQEQIARFVWDNDTRPELRMEAVLILGELGHNSFTREQLNRIVADARFKGDELQQAAVWELGKAGLKCYEDLLPFIDNADENLALHAIGAFGTDTPRPVITRLVQDLISGDLRRAQAASEVLRIVASDDVLLTLAEAANATPLTIPDWVSATLGRLPPALVRSRLQGTPLLHSIEPILLATEGASWLTSEDITFLSKQNIF